MGIHVGQEKHDREKGGGIACSRRSDIGSGAK